MRVLGIDPGYDRLGVAVVDKNHAHGVLLFSSCITTDRTETFDQRLGTLGRALSDIFTAHTPDIVAIEHLYFNTNQKTAVHVAEVRGVVVYLASLHGCKVLEYTPQAIKVAVTGYGKSDKRQVADMVTRLLPGIKKDALDDEYDAIAIALTAIASVR